MMFIHKKIFIIAVLPLILLTAVPAVAATMNASIVKTGSLMSSLAGWWTLDGTDIAGTSAYDNSGNNRTGTLTSSPTKIVGKLGQALSVASGSRVSTPNISGQQSWNKMTLSIWIKTKTAATQDILDCQGAYSIVADATGIAGRFDGTWPDNFYAFDYEDNKWHHLVAVYNGTGTTVYVDGVYGNYHAESYYGSSLGRVCAIGTHWDGTVAFTGQVDDARIYNRVFSASEVKQLYNSGQSQQNKSKTTDSLTRGLTGWWTLDAQDVAGTEIYDKSGQGLTGTGATAVTKVIGKIGQAYKFNGTSSNIDLPSLTTGATFTVACWIKTTATGQQSCFNNYDATAGVYFGMGSNKIFSYSTQNTPGSLAGNALINDGKWHLIAYTVGGGKGRLYLDGVLDKEDDQTRVSHTGTGNIGYGGGVNDYWNGTIDDVRMYNRVLSAVEMKQLYNLGQSTANSSAAVRPASGGLVHWWTFDGQDVYGTNAYDKGSGNNTGTLTGGIAKTTGKLGQAIKLYSLAGLDGYVTGTNSVNIATSPITASAWVKFLGTPGDNYPRVIDIQDANYSAQIVWDHGSGGSDQWVTKHFEWQTSSNGTQWGETPSLNTWYHLVAVWDATANTTNFYVNGVAKTGSANANINDGADRNKYFIGVRGDLNSVTYANAIVDDVRLWNRALSAAEVKQLYNGGK